MKSLEKNRPKRRPTQVRLLEPRDVKIAVEFLHELIYLRMNEDLPEAQALNGTFSHDYDIIAKLKKFNYGWYRNLPHDTKSFISRCANLCKSHRHLTLHQIVREQAVYMEQLSNELYHDFKKTAEQHAWEYEKRPRLEAEWYKDAEKNPGHMYHPEDEYIIA